MIPVAYFLLALLICVLSGKDNSKAATTTPTTTPAEKEDSDEKDSEEVSTCDDVDCGDHGECNEGQDGQAECSCETGFAGDRCQRQHCTLSRTNPPENCHLKV